MLAAPSIAEEGRNEAPGGDTIYNCRVRGVTMGVLRERLLVTPLPS